MLTPKNSIRFSPDTSSEGGSFASASLNTASRGAITTPNWSPEERGVLSTILLAIGSEARVCEVGSGAGTSPAEIGGYWARYVGYDADPKQVDASNMANQGRKDLEFHTATDYSASIANMVESNGLFSLLFCREDKLVHFGAHPAQQLSQLLQFANVLAVVTHPSSGQINGTHLHAPIRTTNPPNSKAGFTIPELLSFAKAIPGDQSFSLRSAGPGAAVLIISRLPEVPGTSLFERMDYFDATRHD